MNPYDVTLISYLMKTDSEFVSKGHMHMCTYVCATHKCLENYIIPAKKSEFEWKSSSFHMHLFVPGLDCIFSVDQELG